jgi:hypothetical protein
MNNLTRMPPVGTQQGSWVWDGSNWVCDPNCDNGGGFPPFGPPVFSGPTQQPPWYPGANGGVSFGATAPPNPVRGHMWWNGTTFYLFDGAAWTPIGGTGSGGGAATGTTPPANPFNGQQWFNGSTLFVWDGNAWVPVSTTKSSVQPTAPPNPNPGDLWFDGTVQRIWSGSAWVLVGPGATVGPVGTTQKTFEVATNVASSIPGTAWEIAPISGSPTVNISGAWDVNNKTWTPSRAGVYNFQIAQYNPNAQGTFFGIILALNDSGTPFSVSAVNQFAFAETTATGVWVVSNGMQAMNGTTDFVRLWTLGTGTWPATSPYPNIRAFILP